MGEVGLGGGGEGGRGCGDGGVYLASSGGVHPASSERGGCTQRGEICGGKYTQLIRPKYITKKHLKYQYS